MITLTCIQIMRDLLMTALAQAILLRFGKRNVAGDAIGFQTGVCRRKWTGRNQPADQRYREKRHSNRCRHQREPQEERIARHRQ